MEEQGKPERSWKSQSREGELGACFTVKGNRIVVEEEHCAAMFPWRIKWTSANLRETANLDTNEVPGRNLADLAVQRVGLREFPRSTFSPRDELIELLREGIQTARFCS